MGAYTRVQTLSGTTSTVNSNVYPIIYAMTITEQLCNAEADWGIVPSVRSIASPSQVKEETQEAPKNDDG